MPSVRDLADADMAGARTMIWRIGAGRGARASEIAPARRGVASTVPRTTMNCAGDLRCRPAPTRWVRIPRDAAARCAAVQSAVGLGDSVRARAARADPAAAGSVRPNLARFLLSARAASAARSSIVDMASSTIARSLREAGRDRALGARRA
ncbi:MAG: hypothetical protein IT438_05320 [Phycisphaerales bacterium]|nr:hypothetical protein [Phycisphaerales bacterium]